MLQREGIFSKDKDAPDAKRSSMLCVFIYKRALCFDKYLYPFKSEINLMELNC